MEMGERKEEEKMKKVVIATSWDDGHPLDVELATLLRRYGIPATFYIPVNGTERGRLDEEQIKAIAEHFEVGAHTVNHLDLTRIPLKNAEVEIVNSKKVLEEIIGRKVTSFSYPWGQYNKEIIKLVKKAGFVNARTVKQLAVTNNQKKTFAMTTTVHAANHTRRHYLKQLSTSRDLGFSLFFIKNNLFAKSWDEIAVKTLDYVVERGGVWHLWGHTYEVDWVKLERVFKKISQLMGRRRK